MHVVSCGRCGIHFLYIGCRIFPAQAPNVIRVLRQKAQIIFLRHNAHRKFKASYGPNWASAALTISVIGPKYFKY